MYLCHHVLEDTHGLVSRLVVAMGSLLVAWFGIVGNCNAEQAPNIIYLMTDDQRADALGCYGNSIIHTPHIDKLAAQGVAFDRAFVPTAICMTNRACVLTGQYAARHGVWSFSQDLSKEQIANTYIGKLKEAGYRTGFIGKWGVGNPSTADEILDYNEGFPGQSRYFQGDVKKKEGRHLTAKLGDQAIEFLKQCNSDELFHLSVSFKAPHCQDSSDIYSDQFPSDPAWSHLYQDLLLPMPFTAAHEYFDRMPNFLKDSINRDRWAVRFRSPDRYQQSVKDYYRLITGVDAVVGRIRDELAKRSMEENTVIIFTSDHGFFLGEYGFAGKWTPHDVSIRVPLVVFDPAMDSTQRGSRRQEMTLSIDMAATMLDMAGIDAPDEMQGASLLPILAGERPADWRTSFFYEHWYTANGLIAPSEAVRDDRWKYARYLVPDELEEGTARFEELYDLKADPHETRNLASDPRYLDILEEQREAWKTWRADVR